MKFLKLFKKTKKQKTAISDFYQASVNRVGQDQLKKLSEKGLSIPVLSL